MYPRLMADPCICITLRQAALASTAFQYAVLALSSLKINVFSVLRRICESPENSITGLAHLVRLDSSTLGRNLKVLERQGLARISVDADERARTIDVTETGAAALATALPLWETAQARLKLELGTDIDSLLASMAQTSALADTERDPDQ